MVKDFLKENNIKFEEVLLNSEDAIKEMFEKSCQMSVPVLDINGNIVVGFDTEKIKFYLNF